MSTDNNTLYLYIFNLSEYQYNCAMSLVVAVTCDSLAYMQCPDLQKYLLWNFGSQPEAMKMLTATLVTGTPVKTR